MTQLKRSLVAAALLLPVNSAEEAPLIDGRPPGSARGVVVDAQASGLVGEPRLYQLIREPDSIIDRQFEIEFLDSGVEAFVFTLASHSDQPA